MIKGLQHIFTNMSTELTKENLEKLVSEYESSLKCLEQDHKSINRIDYTWNFSKNRFFDVRRDDDFLEKQIDMNHSSTCKAVCQHGRTQREIESTYICNSECYPGRMNDGFCPIHQICTCNVDCDCYDNLSTGTFATECFVRNNGVTPLIYQTEGGHEVSDLWYCISKPIDPEKDPYMLRMREINRYDVYRLTLSLNSIPILEKNIERLSKELIRQESYRWCMANIRAMRFLYFTDRKAVLKYGFSSA